MHATFKSATNVTNVTLKYASNIYKRNSGACSERFKMYEIFRIKFNVSETNKLMKLKPERQHPPNYSGS